VAASLSGNSVGLDQRSCSTTGQVSTVMGDLRGYTIFVCNQCHPGLLSLAIPSYVCM